MPERDRAAVDVQAIGVDRQFTQAGERLRGECFVQLDQIDLIEREPGELQHLPDRRNRPDAEPLRLDARRRERDEPAERRQAALRGQRLAGHDDRGSAVAGLRRVAGGHRARDVKRRPQFRERRGRRIAPRTFIHGERRFR